MSGIIDLKSDVCSMVDIRNSEVDTGSSKGTHLLQCDQVRLCAQKSGLFGGAPASTGGTLFLLCMRNFSRSAQS